MQACQVTNQNLLCVNYKLLQHWKTVITQYFKFHYSQPTAGTELSCNDTNELWYEQVQCNVSVAQNVIADIAIVWIYSF